MVITFPTPNPTAPTRFSALVNYLATTVAGETGANRIPLALFLLIRLRLGELIMRFQRAAFRVRDGLYLPRPDSPTPRKSPTQKAPRQPSKLPIQFGWLGRLIPDSGQPRGYLNRLLGDPEMMALLEAGPPAMVRSVRSLCWMMGLTPPANLPKGQPRRKKPAPPPPPPAAEADAAASSPPEPPAVPIDWSKPRGSISNRLYRNYKPPGDRPPKKSA